MNVPDDGTPAEAIAAVTDMIEDRYDGTICQRDYDVLSAAAPVIAAQAAAAQREADIKLADDHNARCCLHADEDSRVSFADLLAAAPDTTTTGKETR